MLLRAAGLPGSWAISSVEGLSERPPWQMLAQLPATLPLGATCHPSLKNQHEPPCLLQQEGLEEHKTAGFNSAQQVISWNSKGDTAAS